MASLVPIARMHMQYAHSVPQILEAVLRFCSRLSRMGMTMHDAYTPHLGGGAPRVE
jgi:hypothetical protein